MASPTTNKSELERPPDPTEVGNILQNSEQIGEDLKESEATTEAVKDRLESVPETSEAVTESSKVVKTTPEAVKAALEDVEEVAEAVIKTPNEVIKSPELHDATHELIHETPKPNDATSEPIDATLDITTEQADARPEPPVEMEDAEETPESIEVEEPLEDPLTNKETSKKMNINGASELESIGIEAPRKMEERKKNDKEDDDIREERIITDNPDLMCLVRCEICNKDRREFRGHLRTVHKMKYPEYKEKYGKIVYTRLTYHRCRLCNEIIEYEFWNFKNHLRKCHDIDTVSYCLHHLKTTVEVTDRVDEMCQVHCSVCKISVTCSALDGHVSKLHGLSSAEYKKQYGENPSYTSLTYHR